MINTITTNVLVTCGGCNQDKTISMFLSGEDAQILDGKDLSAEFFKYARDLGWVITNERVRCPSCNGVVEKVG
jgi:hypothetical protein